MILLHSHSLSGLKVPSHAMSVTRLGTEWWKSSGVILRLPSKQFLSDEGQEKYHRKFDTKEVKLMENVQEIASNRNKLFFTTTDVCNILKI